MDVDYGKNFLTQIEIIIGHLVDQNFYGPSGD